jgi:hypothetical protein
MNLVFSLSPRKTMFVDVMNLEAQKTVRTVPATMNMRNAIKVVACVLSFCHTIVSIESSSEGM